MDNIRSKQQKKKKTHKIIDTRGQNYIRKSVHKTKAFYQKHEKKIQFAFI